MAGVELVRDAATKAPAPEATLQVLQRSMARGVLAVRCGLYGNVIRFLVPLVIKDDELDEAIAILEDEMLAL